MKANTTQGQAGPLVTIVTPAYNQAEYLTETVESVLTQDYPNLEYIVLDDGSTDGTSKVLERYTGRVRWERHANMGQSLTLNKGWSMARGELLGYISSDDRLRKDCVSQLVAAMSGNAEAVAVYGDYALIDSAGGFVRSVVAKEYSPRGLVGDLICYPGPGALFRRSVFEAAGGWNPSLRQVPDFDFWLRASRYGPFLRVASSLAELRIHSNSASFRKVDASRSDEIIGVVADYWSGHSGPLERKSKGTSYLLAGRSHLVSGRYRTACARIGTSLRYSPLGVFAPRNMRHLLGGLLRQLYYERMHEVRSKPERAK